MSTEEDKKVPAPAEAAAIESPPELTEGDAAKPESEASPQETEEKAPSQEADQTPVEEGKSKEGKSEEGKSGEESKGSESSTKKPKRKETKKRVRRVGKTEPRKILKTEIDSTPAQVAPTESEAAPPDSAPESASSIEARRVLSKHDEKWNAMFDKLVAYKNANGHTLVPQCYHEDPRLGRWVHYQRVEYWIFQQSGTGKITPERIARLEGMGFEWDPQKAQWNMLFDKLVKFKEEFGHCKVPKGYAKDTELANWVRNQRLEQANMKKGKKSRMTPERYQKLNDLGFKWSTSIARKGSRKQPDDTPKVEGTTIEDEAAKLEAESPSEADAPVKKEEEEAKGSAAAGETTEVVQI